MAEKLTPEDIAFNAGIDAAIKYHEDIAANATKVWDAMPHAGPDSALGMTYNALGTTAFKIRSVHRAYSNDLAKMRRQTDAEIAEDEARAVRMNE